MKNLFDQLLQPTVLVAVLGAIAALVRYVIIKSNERRSINRALLSEISRLLSVIVRHKTWWEECIKNGDTDLPLINFSTDVYDTLLKFWGEVEFYRIFHHFFVRKATQEISKGKETSSDSKNNPIHLKADNSWVDGFNKDEVKVKMQEQLKEMSLDF